jgi:hypothetical protein
MCVCVCVCERNFYWSIKYKKVEHSLVTYEHDNNPNLLRNPPPPLLDVAAEQCI